MVCDDNLSEFALSRVVEVMKSGVCCSHDFKERHMVRIANDVLNFTGKQCQLLRCTTTSESIEQGVTRYAS
jgi:hypothetical protein